MKIPKKWLEKHKACKLVKEDRTSDAWRCLKKRLTKKQFQQITLYAAIQVLPIFERKYPNDLRVRKCINATKKYLKTPNQENLDDLRVKKLAANAATTYAACAIAAVYAAAAVTYDAAYDDSYAAFTDAAVDAACAAAFTDTARREMQLKIVKYAVKLI